MKKNILFFLVSLLFLACSKKESKVENVERAFYYWKSTTSFGDETIQKIRKSEI